MNPEDHIKDIRSRYLNADKEFVLSSLNRGIDRLQKAFPRYGSFIMEFIQNADDAGSKTLQIEIKGNEVIISNDGRPFSLEDVNSICKVGLSSKTPKEYIGYLGVGFKAVFLISEFVEIYSGDYRFKFDKKSWDDPEHTPWQIIPLWIDNPSLFIPKGYNTTFRLITKEYSLIEKIKKEVDRENLSNRILLFLRNIREIKIKITNNSQEYKREISKSIVSKSQDYEIFQIQENENGTTKTKDLWLVFRSTYEVPEEIRKDSVTIEWERKDVEKREVVAAFRLDNENNLVKEEKGTAHIGVFSFLPLKEVPSGLNFLIQGDFLTTPGRGELARECRWNDWLATKIYDMIANKIIPTFLRHDKWKLNFTEILYSSAGGHELFERFIKEPLREFLQNNKVLIAEDGTPSKIDELIWISKEVREIISDEDFNFLYPNKKIIHPECKPHPKLNVDKVPAEIIDFIKSPDGEKLLKRKAELGNVEWFKKLYSKIVDKYQLYSYFYPKYWKYNVEHDRFWDNLRVLQTPIILTENNELAKINECYVNTKGLNIPNELKQYFKIVHPSIVKDENFEKFRKMLNEVRYHRSPPKEKVLREITEEDIKSAIKTREIFKMTKEDWESFSDKEKIEKIKLLKKIVE